MRNIFKRQRQKRAVLEHMILPGAGASIATIATILQARKTKDSTKEKLKQIARNATLGAMVGGGLELGRVGISNLLAPNDEPLTGTRAMGNYIYK